MGKRRNPVRRDECALDEDNFFFAVSVLTFAMAGRCGGTWSGVSRLVLLPGKPMNALTLAMLHVGAVMPELDEPQFDSLDKRLMSYLFYCDRLVVDPRFAAHVNRTATGAVTLSKSLVRCFAQARFGGRGENRRVCLDHLAELADEVDQRNGGWNFSPATQLAKMLGEIGQSNGGGI